MKQNIKNILMIHLIVVLFFLFVFYTPTHFGFLIWNVFLALLPADFALLAISAKNRLLKAVFSLLWLLFYPNTMYMITDFIHLQYISTSLDVRFQYFNYAVLSAGIFIGVTLGVLSLEIIFHRFFVRVNDLTRLAVMFIMSLISAFGIYLGRFLRLNSWDVFTKFQTVWDSIMGSLSLHMIAFVVLFAGVQFAILVIYHYGGRVLINLSLDSNQESR
ncbi:DUF1361 domain-containing protein [Leuconostocaceae bacterium ESL0723]|nr:DUF1361 domain-containing protein [Leuconostocaceae bacterium ESL0723]